MVKTKIELSPSGEHNQPVGNVCIANISPRERMKRLMSGIIPFVIAVGILAWLVSAHTDRLWRLPLFFLLLLAYAAIYYM